jgi:hypothetical protein
MFVSLFGFLYVQMFALQFWTHFNPETADYLERILRLLKLQIQRQRLVGKSVFCFQNALGYILLAL